MITHHDSDFNFISGNYTWKEREKTRDGALGGGGAGEGRIMSVDGAEGRVGESGGRGCLR